MRHTLTRLRATVRSHIAVRITASRGILHFPERSGWYLLAERCGLKYS